MKSQWNPFQPPFYSHYIPQLYHHWTAILAFANKLNPLYKRHHIIEYNSVGYIYIYIPLQDGAPQL